MNLRKELLLLLLCTSMVLANFTEYKRPIAGEVRMVDNSLLLIDDEEGNVYESSNNGEEWQHLCQLPEAYSHVYRTTFAPFNKKLIFVEDDNDSYSTDGGQTWMVSALSGGDLLFAKNKVYLQFTANSVGYQNSYLFEFDTENNDTTLIDSVDSTMNYINGPYSAFFQYHAFPYDERIFRFECDTWSSSREAFYIDVFDGETWTRVNDTILRDVHDIEEFYVDENNKDHWYIVNHVSANDTSRALFFETKDGGKTWEEHYGITANDSVQSVFPFYQSDKDVWHYLQDDGLYTLKDGKTSRLCYIPALHVSSAHDIYAKGDLIVIQTGGIALVSTDGGKNFSVKNPTIDDAKASMLYTGYTQYMGDTIKELNLLYNYKNKEWNYLPLNPEKGYLNVDDTLFYIFRSNKVYKYHEASQTQELIATSPSDLERVLAVRRDTIIALSDDYKITFSYNRGKSWGTKSDKVSTYKGTVDGTAFFSGSKVDLHSLEITENTAFWGTFVDGCYYNADTIAAQDKAYEKGYHISRYAGNTNDTIFDFSFETLKNDSLDSLSAMDKLNLEVINDSTFYLHVFLNFHYKIDKESEYRTYMTFNGGQTFHQAHNLIDGRILHRFSDGTFLFKDETGDEYFVKLSAIDVPILSSSVEIENTVPFIVHKNSITLKEHKNLQGISRVSLLNAKGQIIREQSFTGTAQTKSLDLHPSLASGIYFLSIAAQDKEIVQAVRILK